MGIGQVRVGKFNNFSILLNIFHGNEKLSLSEISLSIHIGTNENIFPPQEFVTVGTRTLEECIRLTLFPIK